MIHQSLLLVLGLLVASSIQADRSYFQPYGPANGDDTLHRNDDEFTGAVVLIGGMNFFGSVRQTLYVDNNGIITLDQTSWVYTPESMDVLDVATIAPYWSDVDTRPDDGGFLYYRSTLDVALCAEVSQFIRDSNPGSTFTGTRAFVATWSEVGYYNRQTDKFNTFQCVLIADDLGNTYALFNYGDMTWTTGDASGGTNGFGGVPAVVGFAKGTDGIYSQLATSMTADIVDVELGTNVYINGVPQTGQYLFSVGDGVVITPCCSISNPPVLSGTPAQLNFNVTSINDVPPFTGTVTATYECSSPSTEVITPVEFYVFGCPVTRTWTGTDDCLKATSVQQVFVYPEVFSEPLSLTVPSDYSVAQSCDNPVAPLPSVSGIATSNRGNITYTDSIFTSTTSTCSMTRYWIAQDICNSFLYGSQVITFDASTPLTTGEVTSQELTTEALTTQPLTTEALTTQPLTTSFRTVADRCRTYTFPETQGYFCSADHTGYYQCLKGPWASQAAFRPCAPGTSCKCDVGVECTAFGICTNGV